MRVFYFLKEEQILVGCNESCRLLQFVFSSDILCEQCSRSVARVGGRAIFGWSSVSIARGIAWCAIAWALGVFWRVIAWARGVAWFAVAEALRVLWCTVAGALLLWVSWCVVAGVFGIAWFTVVWASVLGSMVRIGVLFHPSNQTIQSFHVLIVVVLATIVVVIVWVRNLVAIVALVSVAAALGLRCLIWGFHGRVRRRFWGGGARAVVGDFAGGSIFCRIISRNNINVFCSNCSFFRGLHLGGLLIVYLLCLGLGLTKRECFSYRRLNLP